MFFLYFRSVVVGGSEVSPRIRAIRLPAVQVFDFSYNITAGLKNGVVSVFVDAAGKFIIIQSRKHIS